MSRIIYLSIILIIFFIISTKYLYKDVLSPAFLIGFPWLISLILLPFTDFNYNKDSYLFLYFVLGIFVFIIGYTFIIIFSSGVKRGNGFCDVKTKVNIPLVKIIIFIEILVILYELIYSYNNIASAFQYNFYFTLKSSESNSNFFIDYFRSFSIAFTLFIIIAHFKSTYYKSKNLILLTQLILGSISVFLTLGRTSIFLTVTASFTIYVIYTFMDNNKVIKMILLFGTIGTLVFSIYNVLKYPYLLETNSMFNVIKETLFVYTSSSLVTFQKWADLDVDFTFGENTFRFLRAVLNSIGYNLKTNSLVNNFVNISNDNASNVYTFYHYYAMDFGMIYALIIQFFIGVFHGYLYVKMTRKSPFWVYLFALSIYPLLMQFFQDQYFSLTSTWIQYLFYGIILFNTQIFMKTQDI